jgi:glycosyltransferase involved in cell wall biosynthesis
MDLIYYYPTRTDAPANVARNVFECLYKQRKELPFENLKLFVPFKHTKDVQKQFSDLEVVTYKNLNNTSKNSVIHIPISPLVYPNSKFLLHLFAVLKKRKLILQYHGDIRTEMRLKFKYAHSLNIFDIPSYILMPYLLKSADKMLVNSYLMSELVRSRYGVKNDAVIPNGIDGFWFEESDETNIELNGDPVFFYHGRLSPEKGVDLLMKGFSKAIEGSSKARLYIAADGPQQKYLEDLCRNLRIEKNVMFLGYIKQKYIKTYLSNVDAAIYPSRYDSFSLAILEAFSSAKYPVYFSKLAGIYDFVVRDGYDLCVFEPTVDHISKIVEDVINGNYDLHMIKRQKEFVKRYTWNCVFNNYMKIYDDIVLGGCYG